MNVEQTYIEGLLVLTPKVFGDERGYFLESYNKSTLDPILSTTFVQDNESASQKGVLRGMHFQNPPYGQAKLVRVIKGSVLDVVVDLRKDSKTYGKHYKHVLSGEHKEQLYIPEGFAHGFLVLEDDTIFSYKCSRYYHAASEVSIMWNDPTLGINWQIEDPIISEKDRNAIKFEDFNSPF